MQQLVGLLTAVGEGRGGIAVVKGLTATGKTDLLRTFAEQAADRGALVLTAIGSLAEQSLPLAVIGQLLDSPSVSRSRTDHLSPLFDYWGAARDELPAAQHASTAAPTLHELSRIFLELAAETPLMIAVDEVTQADQPSLQCLAYLARRIRRARILVVMTATVPLVPRDFLLRGELMRGADCLMLEVEALSRCGVEQFFEERLPGWPAALAAEAHRLTGGNPLLVNGVVEDCRRAAEGTPSRLAVGDQFVEAVSSCLHRCEPTLQRVIRLLATLGEPLQPGTLRRLSGLDAGTAERAVRMLNRLGLLDGQDFRHPLARAAVLAQTGADERTAIHARAAALLHGEGKPATVVARHLVEADRAEPTWAPLILQDAAAEALSEGRTDEAVEYLHRAHAASTNAGWRASISMMLARSMWRRDPADVVARLPELSRAVREGRLWERDALTVIHFLAWHGQQAEALDQLRSIASGHAQGHRMRQRIEQTRLQLAFLYPGLGVGSAREGASAEADPATSLAHGDEGRLGAAEALARTVMLDPDLDAPEAAESLLRSTLLSDDTVAQLSSALYVLIFADRLAAAALWADRLIEESRRAQSPTWESMMHSIRSGVALRQGDLPGAESHAERSMSLLTERGLSIGIGAPLATLILGATRVGNLEAAASYLLVPVPTAMDKTPFGVLYRYARGAYRQACGRFPEAAADFEECGNLVAAWGLDVPAFMPWRSDLALAYQSLGRPDEGVALLRQQLSMVGDREPRVKGITLRTLAALSDPLRRVPLLREAVVLQKASGNRLEEADTLTDLSDAYQHAGDWSRARVTLRAARNVAKQANGDAEVQRPDKHPLPVDPPPLDEEPAPSTPPELTALSDAERRVAALAVLGCTNREIAGKLYITVSTVEQHLTRVYRKLRVNRRRELPRALAHNWTSREGLPPTAPC